MIIGHGIDLIDIRRIDRTIDRFGERFIKRFAAKEACSKALGTGFRLGVYWKNIEVVNEKSGKPTLKLTGGAYERLKKLTPIGSTHNISLSITDDFPWAQANVIIEVIKK